MATGLGDPRLKAVLAAGASLALYLAPWFIPLLGTTFTVWCPAPLILLYRRQGLGAGRTGLIMAAGGALAFFFSLGAPLAGFYYLFHAALALVLGEAPWWRIPPDRAVAVAAGAGLSLILVVAWSGGVFSISGLADIQGSYWQEKLAQVLEIYRRSGLSEQEIEAARQLLTSLGGAIIRLAPGILASGALLLAWINLLVTMRLERSRSTPPSLDTWQAPEVLVWVLIPAGLAMAFGSGFWFWLGANLVLVVSLVYFFQGMAVVAFWLHRKNASGLIKTVVYLLVAVEFFVAILVAALGLFDIWFNFRRLPPAAPPPAAGSGSGE